MIGVPTAVHEVIDLLLGHSGTLSGSQAALLLLAPLVDKPEILCVTRRIVNSHNSKKNNKSLYTHM